MEKNYKTVCGLCEAKTPIFHGGNEKTGSTPILRTIMIWHEGGGVSIPYIHGNAVRGKLRRMLMKDMLEVIGYSVTNKKLHHSLFSGGVLEGTEKTSGALDLTLRKEIVDMLPPISLFGCGIGNQLIQGKLVVGHMWPICKEYKAFLPTSFQSDQRAQQPVRVFTDESFITRRDDLREEREKDEQAVQMKVDYECFIPGTAFYHEFKLLFTNSVEESCFSRLLSLWKMHPNVGGRGSSGDGLLILHYDWEGKDDAYMEHLNTKAKEIASLLKKLEGML